MHPFMAAELGQHFSLEAALQHGLIPLVLGAPNAQEALEAYVSLYLRQEIQLEGAVRDLGSFSRFLETVSFSQAQALNIANVARECDVGRKAAEGYLEVLEDMLVSFRLPVFTKRAKRQVAAHHKFYFFDAGIYRLLRPSGPLDRPEEVAWLRAREPRRATPSRLDCYRRDKHELFYWRTRSQLEVDFVVYGATGLWAIEVKNTASVRSQDLKPLKSFRDDYPECVPIFVYRGPERLLVDGVLCVSGDEFLRQIDREQGLTGAELKGQVHRDGLGGRHRPVQRALEVAPCPWRRPDTRQPRCPRCRIRCGSRFPGTVRDRVNSGCIGAAATGSAGGETPQKPTG